MKYTGRIMSQVIIVVGSVVWTAYLNAWDKPITNFFPILLELLLAWWLGKQYDIAKFYSEKDGLTEVYNRRFALAMFGKLLAIAERSGEPFSILVVDADNLKTVNDTLGHQRGDEVIQRLARILQDCTRKSDMVARMGGDEFVIAAPGTDREAAQVVVERIKQALKAESQQAGIELSVSIGVATFPEDGRVLESLMKIADDRMYEKKQEKKNVRACMP